ncbi:MAG: hypothetical protein D3910_13995, partial [Candidatus Electrothrix sp. ATG2]|nr:hypothetical protein [Candidatus Electrothrix sp. ATG2]
EEEIGSNATVRQGIISIGLAILLPDGENLLRGPQIKSVDAHHGWVDPTSENMQLWKKRLQAVHTMVQQEGSDTSSLHDRAYAASREWGDTADCFDIGEIVAWILTYEEGGRRVKE